MKQSLKITYIGGPTALLQVGTLRLLTDPTFDAAGQEFQLPSYNLRKTAGPAMSSDAIGRIDLVLLSHDHHFDNLDNSGRMFLQRAGIVLTTRVGAERLKGQAVALAPWEHFDLAGQAGLVLRITATPARHGPADHDRGPVIGFVLILADAPIEAIYVSGDTAWYDGIIEIAKRFPIRIAILFMGAARVPEVGPEYLTFTAAEAVEFARAVPRAAIVPLHYEGWTHYSETRAEITEAFTKAGIKDRLCWCEAGHEIAVEASAD